MLGIDWDIAIHKSPLYLDAKLAKYKHRWIKLERALKIKEVVQK